MRIGLRLRRRVGGPRGSQVTETRHRDHPHAVAGQWPSPVHALVVSAAAAVDHQQRQALARLLVFDRAATGVDHGAAGRSPQPGIGHVPLERPADAGRGDH